MPRSELELSIWELLSSKNAEGDGPQDGGSVGPQPCPVEDGRRKKSQEGDMGVVAVRGEGVCFQVVMVV